MVSSNRIDACQTPDSRTEAGHVVLGMGADLWCIEGLLVPWSQVERWQGGKPAHPILGEEVPAEVP